MHEEDEVHHLFSVPRLPNARFRRGGRASAQLPPHTPLPARRRLQPKLRGPSVLAALETASRRFSSTRQPWSLDHAIRPEQD
jgi:hypothetical protein